MICLIIRVVLQPAGGRAGSVFTPPNVRGRTGRSSSVVFIGFHVVEFILISHCLSGECAKSKYQNKLDVQLVNPAVNWEMNEYLEVLIELLVCVLHI